MSPKYKPTDLLWATVITVVPVAVVILMQKPALRQELAMRWWRAVRNATQAQADFWQTVSDQARQNYWKATL
jgi:hypothetical protein